MAIFKTVDVAGKTTFSDKKGAAGVAYTPGAPALGSMNPAAAIPFANQVATSYTPKPLNSISAARSQLTSYQNNLSEQMSQAAVSGIKPVEFEGVSNMANALDVSKGGNITQAVGEESDALFNRPRLKGTGIRMEEQAAQKTSPAEPFNSNWAGTPISRNGSNDYEEWKASSLAAITPI